MAQAGCDRHGARAIVAAAAFGATVLVASAARVGPASTQTVPASQAAGSAVAATTDSGGASSIADDPTPAQSATTAPDRTFRSNEDPAHEVNETAQQEAAENAGRRPGGRRGPGHHGPRCGQSNEDPAHESSETAQQEAAENACASPTPSPSPAV